MQCRIDSAFVGYELTKPKPEPALIRQTSTAPVITSQSLTPELVAAFSYRTANRTLQYVVPNSAEEIEFTNETSVSPSSVPLNYGWSLDGRTVGNTRDYSCTVSETKTSGLPHQVNLAVSSGPWTSSTEASIDVDPQTIPEYPSKELRTPIKGVNYSAARLDGWHTAEDETRECMWLTKNELGCNAAYLGVETGWYLWAGCPLVSAGSLICKLSVQETF